MTKCYFYVNLSSLILSLTFQGSRYVSLWRSLYTVLHLVNIINLKQINHHIIVVSLEMICHEMNLLSLLVVYLVLKIVSVVGLMRF